MPIGIEKGLLRDVPGRFHIAQPAIGYAHDEVLMAHDQLIECFPIAELRLPDQRDVLF